MWLHVILLVQLSHLTNGKSPYFMKLFKDAGVGIQCPSGNRVYVHPITADLQQCSQQLGKYNETSCPGGTVCERFPILIPGFQDYCCWSDGSTNSEETVIGATTSPPEDLFPFIEGSRRKEIPEVEAIIERPDSREDEDEWEFETTRPTKRPRSRKFKTTTTEKPTTTTTRRPKPKSGLPTCTNPDDSPHIDFGNRLRDCYHQQCFRGFRCEFNQEIRRFICCGPSREVLPPPAGLPMLPAPKPLNPRPFRPRPTPFGMLNDGDQGNFDINRGRPLNQNNGCQYGNSNQNYGCPNDNQKPDTWNNNGCPYDRNGCPTNQGNQNVNSQQQGGPSGNRINNGFVPGKWNSIGDSSIINTPSINNGPRSENDGMNGRHGPMESDTRGTGTFSPQHSNWPIQPMSGPNNGCPINYGNMYGGGPGCDWNHNGNDQLPQTNGVSSYPGNNFPFRPPPIFGDNKGQNVRSENGDRGWADTPNKESGYFGPEPSGNVAGQFSQLPEYQERGQMPNGNERNEGMNNWNTRNSGPADRMESDWSPSERFPGQLSFRSRPKPSHKPSAAPSCPPGAEYRLSLVSPQCTPPGADSCPLSHPRCILSESIGHHVCCL